VGITGQVKNGSENIEECIKQPINFEKAHQRLEVVKEKSYEYLIKSYINKENTDM